MPLNIRLAAPEVIYTVNDAEAIALVVDETFLPLIEGIGSSLKTVRTYLYTGSANNLPASVQEYEQLLREADELQQAPPVREEDLAGLFYTSGTTGHAKGVMLTNRNLCANALQGLTLSMPTHESIHLHSTPMFHLSGGPSVWLVFWVAGTHVVQQRFEPKSTFELIERERVTRVVWVPTMINMLLSHPDIGKVDFSSLQCIGYGASPIAPEDHQPEGDERTVRHLLSCGREVLGVTVRVVNGQGQEVAPGEVGEIIARGANIMPGYWRKPEETAAVPRDGWYYSGDMGTMDEGGYLYIVDRKKDMIISGGENIYSVEVEHALSSHPAVLECAVVGVPDEQWGEAVKALGVWCCETGGSDEWVGVTCLPRSPFTHEPACRDQFTASAQRDPTPLGGRSKLVPTGRGILVPDHTRKTMTRTRDEWVGVMFLHGEKRQRRGGIHHVRLRMGPTVAGS